MTNAILANTATNLTGYFMGQLRTANKRHKRAVARQAKIISTKDPKNAATPQKTKA